MEKVTTKLISNLIDEALEYGKSKSIEIDDSELNYFRVIISKFNFKNKSELSIRRVQGVNWEVRAPLNRFTENDEWKGCFKLIQCVIDDPGKKISSEELKIITDKLGTLIEVCVNRLDNDDLKNAKQDLKQWDKAIKSSHDILM